MYTISYNDKIIKLANVALESHLKESSDSLKVYYPGKSKFLLSCLDKIEKDDQLQELIILAIDHKSLKSDFESLFKIIPAAGGLVLNNLGEVLMIFRRGSWDLPKGKIDAQEKKKDAAVREVQEETGLVNVQLLNKLVTTYHIYRGQTSNRRILKPSYWYLMYSTDQKLEPQLEEDIQRAEWVKLKDARKKLRPMYRNIYFALDALLHYINP
jgi:8-oxo-dGTP pyrophosphatase MutT (NUDIX family)